MKGLGKGIKEFNSAKANIESEIKDNMREIEEPKKEAILEKKSIND
ncbi:UNVERIFIED_CONTAM: hypothetical protein GTU68_033031 [Idotea baltica]|nr:hypothetical protein [Idotea baltica]